MLNLPLKYYFETEKYEILEFKEILVTVFVFSLVAFLLNPFLKINNISVCS